MFLGTSNPTVQLIIAGRGREEFSKAFPQLLGSGFRGIEPVVKLGFVELPELSEKVVE